MVFFFLQNLSRQSSLVEDRFDDSDDDEFQEERAGMLLCSKCKMHMKNRLKSPPLLRCHRTKNNAHKCCRSVNACLGTLQLKCIEPDLLYEILHLNKLYVNVSVLDHANGNCSSSDGNSSSTSCSKTMSKTAGQQTKYNGRQQNGGGNIGGKIKRKSIDLLRRKQFFFTCKKQPRNGWMKMCQEKSKFTKSCDIQ